MAIEYRFEAGLAIGYIACDSCGFTLRAMSVQAARAVVVGSFLALGELLEEPP